MKVRILLFMVLVFVNFFVVQACAISICPADMSGSGTVGDPCQITNCTQLQNMSVNLTLSYALAGNINCSDTVNWNSGLGFEPVGNDIVPFTGTFDGNNNTIHNLYINSTADYVGLFGFTENATIREVGLINVNVTGLNMVGGLTGITNGGTIFRCYSSGGLVYSTGDNVGGLVGSQYASTVNNSYATGNVSGSLWVGGLVGSQDSSSVVSNSYSSGVVSGSDVVGGLIGYSESSSVGNSYSSSNVNGTSSVGGLVGSQYSSTVNNSYATGNVSGSLWVGGLVGSQFYFSTVDNCYWNNHPGNPDDCYLGGNDGCHIIQDDLSYFWNVNSPPMDSWDFDTVWDNICDNVGYPVLQWQGISSVDACPGYTTPPSTTTTTSTSTTTSTTTTTTTLSSSGGAPYRPWTTTTLPPTTITATTLYTTTLTTPTTATTQTVTTITPPTTSHTTTTITVTSTTIITASAVNQTSNTLSSKPSVEGTTLLSDLINNSALAYILGGIILPRTIIILLLAVGGVIILLLLKKREKSDKKGLMNV